MNSNIEFPSTTKSNGNGSFQDCSSLSDVCIPKSIKSIGRYAFYGYRQLCTIDIPKKFDKAQIFDNNGSKRRKS